MKGVSASQVPTSCSRLENRNSCKFEVGACGWVWCLHSHRACCSKRIAALWRAVSHCPCKISMLDRHRAARLPCAACIIQRSGTRACSATHAADAQHDLATVACSTPQAPAHAVPPARMHAAVQRCTAQQSQAKLQVSTARSRPHAPVLAVQKMSKKSLLIFPEAVQPQSSDAMPVQFGLLNLDKGAGSSGHDA